MNIHQNKQLSVRSVVAELLSCYFRVCPKRSTQIINAVSGELVFPHSKNWLAPLMADLYAVLSRINNDDLVYISAKAIKGEVKLYATERKQISSVASHKTDGQRSAVLTMLCRPYFIAC
ncbi:MAG: hypothetical protein JWM28_589 [Chitinophagaceae bacterium]|nr:hypothetical protein [Chitinophagaceae bacterium]